jgi:hypothetical protein
MHILVQNAGHQRLVGDAFAQGAGPQEFQVSTVDSHIDPLAFARRVSGGLAIPGR